MPFPLFLVHEGRCGSTVLTSYLNNPPSVLALNEVLTPGVWLPPSIQTVWLTRRDREQIKGDMYRFLYDLIGALTSDIGCAIIELKFNQLPQDRSSVAHLDKLRQTFPLSRIVVLVRENTLARTISHLRCVNLNIVHCNVTQSVPDGKVVVDDACIPDFAYEPHVKYELLDLLVVDEARHHMLCRVCCAWGMLYLTYESFQASVLQGATRIQIFASLTAHTGFVKYVQTGNGMLDDLIENASRIRENLKGSTFEWMGEKARIAKIIDT